MNKKINYMERRMSRQYLLLVLPGFIIFTIGLIVPLFMAVRYSFTSWDGMSPEKVYVGFKNYIDLFQDSEFRDAWWFTLKFTVGNTVIQNVAALLFAVALDSAEGVPDNFLHPLPDQRPGRRLYMAENVLQCAPGDQ